MMSLHVAAVARAESQVQDMDTRVEHDLSYLDHLVEHLNPGANPQEVPPLLFQMPTLNYLLIYQVKIQSQ